VSRHKSRGLVAEVLDVTDDLLEVLALGGLFKIAEATPLEGGLDGVGLVLGELEDFPGLEAVGTPELLDHGHVGLEVVVHVELDTLRVEDLPGVVSGCGGD